MIALLNDEDRFFETMQKFFGSMTVGLVRPESKKAADTSFSLKEIMGLFRAISEAVEAKLSNDVVGSLAPFGGSYATLEFGQVLAEAGEKGKEIAKHIAMEANFWVTFQRRLISKYLQCFFASVAKKTVKLSQVAARPDQDKEQYVQRFNTTGAETFDDLKEIIDGNFATIPTVCLRLREQYAEALTMKNLAAVLRSREDVDKTEREETMRYCESKFGEAFEDEEEEEDDDSPEEDDKENTGNIQEEDKGAEDETGFDMNTFLAEGGIDPSDGQVQRATSNIEEVKMPLSDIKVHLAKEIGGYLDFGSKKRYFSVLGGKMYCYRTKKDTVADTSFPVIMLKDVKSATLQEGSKLVLKFIDTTQSPVEFVIPPSEDADKWLDCIKNNLADTQSPSQRKKISTQLSMPTNGPKIRALPVPFEMEVPRKKPRKKAGKDKNGGGARKKRGGGKGRAGAASRVPAQAAAEEPSKLRKIFCCCFNKKPATTDEYVKMH